MWGELRLDGGAQRGGRVVAAGVALDEARLHELALGRALRELVGGGGACGELRLEQGGARLRLAARRLPHTEI